MEIEDLLKRKLGLLPAEILGEEQPFTCGNGLRDYQVVCDEITEIAKPRGAERMGKLPNNLVWKLDKKNCARSARSPDWGQLLTVILFPPPKTNYSLEINDILPDKYPGLKVIQGFVNGHTSSFSNKIHHIQVASNASGWQTLIDAAKTPYILVGRDLRGLQNSINFERSLRLLQDPRISVVSGATKNLTGHWHTDCLQSKVVNYYLYIKPGYERSDCDCMICNIVDRAPFMTRKETFREFPLNLELGQHAMFLDWFLRIQKFAKTSLVCPDIMYNTFSSHPIVPTLPENGWISLASLHSFQGVVLDHAPRLAYSFSCDQVDLSCMPNIYQAQHRLLPWCCHKEVSHILFNFHKLSLMQNFRYEIDYGTLLSGVKIGQFSQWDGDLDVTMHINDLKLFQKKGYSNKFLESVGITVRPYHDHFKLHFREMSMDVFGRRELSPEVSRFS